MNLWPWPRKPGAREEPSNGPVTITLVPPGDASVHQCDIGALRHYLDELIATRAFPRAQQRFAVFLIDLRRSDRTQALAGHEHATRVLTSTCASIAGMLRPADRFSVFGIEELMLILPEVDSAGRAMLVANRLVHKLGQALRDDHRTVRLRPAIGCAIFPDHGDDAEALIAAADRARRLAHQSEEGYRIAEPNALTRDEAGLVRDLEQSLRGNQLEVWLQPQLDLHTGRFDAAEALIRWPRTEGRNPVSPTKVVELAEEYGLMPTLTVFVLNTALRASAALVREGVELRIAVNLSATMLVDPNLPRTVQQALELWDVPPDRLTLEVTENTLMVDIASSLATLHDLKGIGTRLSLDDFGTGYSSFAYLRRMPLDELKIDQLFVRNLSVLPDGSANPQREGDLRIVRSIIDIAHNFEMTTVAEGVEDAATLGLLKNLGCDAVQGYYTGRPMPIALVGPWCRERAAA